MCLGLVETKIFANTANNSRMLPQVYLMYLDNVCAVFADTNSCFRFLDTLNSQHNDTKFIMEKANKTLNFVL